MDMKKILQAMDSVKTSAPLEHTTDMKKFMSIVNEGSNPHKVALPVQMAMQHYAPVEEKQVKSSLLKQYMAEASAELEQSTLTQKAELKSYAQYIANKVMETAIPGHSPGFKPGPGGPGIMPAESQMDNPKDVVKMDIPLLIRLLEFSREDAKTDMDLHNVTEMLIKLSSQGDVLTMKQYDQIVSSQRKHNGF